MTINHLRASNGRLFTPAELDRIRQRADNRISIEKMSVGGKSGHELSMLLENKERDKSENYRVGSYLKRLLKSTEFKPSQPHDIGVYILMIDMFDKNNCTLETIMKKAMDLGLRTLTIEEFCYLHLALSHEEIEAIGLTWITALKPENLSSSSVRFLLGGHTFPENAHYLSAYHQQAESWQENGGFAFAVI